MNRIISITLVAFVSAQCFSQVKLWNKDRDKIKTKGTYLELEYNEPVDSSNNKLLNIGLNTVAGALIPYAISYGNSILKNITSVDEKDYNSSNHSINSVSIPYSNLDKERKFSAVLHYFGRGKSKDAIASRYGFNLNKSDNILKISLDTVTIQEKYIPVKIKKKYDFILETFEVTIKAEMSTIKKDSTKVLEIKELGTAKITRLVPSFIASKTRIVNESAFILPQATAKNEKITIHNLLVSTTVTYLNPYGLTQSSLNQFLESNTDTNEALLKAIFLEPSEE
ncbi:hypothetical protein J4050_12130 [Winogradskyella sp. DF17]|uniref:Uncharacterized protein n=1 Tax=Winogradskyella pelagia TaxID=2819984 RepID=A0ABS3T431_9FLAO|nr:hypothetical protein [Winogradskyella sp. DF17]MBO3117502.1 hypothetical protein [Winogradskyella sp. DF17]